MTGKRLMLAALLLLATAAGAVQPGEQLADAALEARARSISTELRCVQCQNQTIDESNAPLARDLRFIVRERLLAGDSDEEVVAFVQARYGDFVLLKPPMSGETAFLWIGPFVLLAIAGLWLAKRSRTMPVAPPQPLSPEDEAQVDAVLGHIAKD